VNVGSDFIGCLVEVDRYRNPKIMRIPLRRLGSRKDPSGSSCLCGLLKLLGQGHIAGGGS
jgi:hypothetical protein